MAGGDAQSPAAGAPPPPAAPRRATAAELYGMSKHLGARCNAEEVAFVACKERYNHPEDCLGEAKAVLTCSQHLLSRPIISRGWLAPWFAALVFARLRLTQGARVGSRRRCCCCCCCCCFCRRA